LQDFVLLQKSGPFR